MFFPFMAQRAFSAIVHSMLNTHAHYTETWSHKYFWIVQYPSCWLALICHNAKKVWSTGRKLWNICQIRRYMRCIWINEIVSLVLGRILFRCVLPEVLTWTQGMICAKHVKRNVVHRFLQRSSDIPIPHSFGVFVDVGSHLPRSFQAKEC